MQNVEFEARQLDQQQHQNKRQRRGDARPRQHEQEKAITKTHASRNSVIAKGPYSVASTTAKAARCNVATTPTPM